MHATLEPHLLFPDLSALWHHPDMHCVLQYLAWAGIEMEYQDAFWTSKKVRDMIKDHFTVVVNRRNVFSDKLYKDDDTIFGWDIYNVRCSLLLLTCLRSCGTDHHACDGMMLACMQCVGVHATDVQLMGPCGKGPFRREALVCRVLQEPRCPASQSGTGCPAAVTAFFGDLSAFIKTVDANHLVSPPLERQKTELHAYYFAMHVIPNACQNPVLEACTEGSGMMLFFQYGIAP